MPCIGYYHEWDPRNFRESNVNECHGRELHWSLSVVRCPPLHNRPEVPRYVHQHEDRKHHIQEYFTKNKEDEKKIGIFYCNEYKWRPFVGDEVKEWVGESLPVWIEEKPECFTDHKKIVIQD